MSEFFTIQCNNVSVSAAQDILTAYAAATAKLRLLAFELAANGQTTVGNYPITLRYLPATVTSGSGGSAVTPNNVNPSGAAAAFTARANDTTVATTSGTGVVLLSSQFNPINGYYWQAPMPHGDEPKAGLSGALTLRLGAAPSGTISVSATMWFEEI